MNTNLFRPIKLGKEVFHPQSYDDNTFIMLYTLEKKGGVPPHVHVHMDERFIIQRGEMTFMLNGKKIVKKSGEEFFVPKGQTHSIKNTGTEQAIMTVTYSPCADTHRMFQVFSSLDEKSPDNVMNMMKYFYIYPKLGWKEFSAIQPPAMNMLMKVIVNIIGKLSGWNKLVNQFR